jgi:ComF family protein
MPVPSPARSAPSHSAALPVLRRYGSAVLDLILPPQCLKCGEIVETSTRSAGALCAACWHEVAFTAPPLCDACGLAFEFDLGPGAVCASCARGRPVFSRARSVFAYDENSRALVLAFKNRDRTDAVPAFARWMTRAGADLLEQADVIVPVPLHWTRLFRRRFNQAALLAAAVAGLSERPWAPDVLVRRRRTAPLGHMSPAMRRRNLQGAFRVRASGTSLIAGRRVLLIDDVLTTGTTVGACARALLGAGADAVDVLTLARIMRPLPESR